MSLRITTGNVVSNNLLAHGFVEEGHTGDVAGARTRAGSMLSPLARREGTG